MIDTDNDKISNDSTTTVTKRSLTKSTTIKVPEAGVALQAPLELLMHYQIATFTFFARILCLVASARCACGQYGGPVFCVNLSIIIASMVAIQAIAIDFNDMSAEVPNSTA